ncbi:di-heme oxidoredictase family protein [Tautonia sociabilis]|uniref:C-type cytochrome n=1 Tax=Tautonia sociabilis TaxID=2080755 RepID=A0A432MG72_9BACT|nr:di-heme oxidoredictase family protein [Tautonia sociabilis]RUL85549.1 c-type cytochrome [Tautonia sociabilis]
MRESGLTRSRRRAGIAMAGAAVLALGWLARPTVPVLRGPRASAERKAEGKALFVRQWLPHDPMAGGDGLGPVFNGRSCVECHAQGGVGGGGGNEHNVLAFEALPSYDRPEVQGGLVHRFAVANHYIEDVADLDRLFPTIPDAITISNGCYVVTRDFEPVKTERVNATALFGAGWVDRIPSRSIVRRNLATAIKAIGRELQSDFDTMPPGRYRVLPDGRIGKFGWKAQFATLEEFVAAACANELGLGTPHRPQAKPRVELPYPDVPPDLDRSQFRSLVAFVDTLPRPEEVSPADPNARAEAERGRMLFDRIGCAVCHVPDLGGVAGVYSDFLLHRLVDRKGTYRQTLADVPLPREHPDPEEWKTPPLWGVADSAPYFHDGASPTLEEAIRRHRGDASPVTKAFDRLGADDQRAVIRFLETLRAPSDAEEAPEPLGPEGGVSVAMGR